MAQIKIYGLREFIAPIRQRLSDVIHSCVVDALQYPVDKRAHRFLLLEEDDFFYPVGRTNRYTILEISMFEGRSVETKKKLMRLLMERAHHECGITPNDLEMTITETPRHNWAFRGRPADEHTLSYKVEV
jgi:phenylpyruvate tautomerase PptA (4-oxalocrotonate tautomerase family)